MEHRSSREDASRAACWVTSLCRPAPLALTQTAVHVALIGAHLAPEQPHEGRPRLGQGPGADGRDVPLGGRVEQRSHASRSSEQGESATVSFPDSAEPSQQATRVGAELTVRRPKP